MLDTAHTHGDSLRSAPIRSWQRLTIVNYCPFLAASAPQVSLISIVKRPNPPPNRAGKARGPVHP